MKKNTTISFFYRLYCESPLVYHSSYFLPGAPMFKWTGNTTYQINKSKNFKSPVSSSICHLVRGQLVDWLDSNVSAVFINSFDEMTGSPEHCNILMINWNQISIFLVYVNPEIKLFIRNILSSFCTNLSTWTAAFLVVNNMKHLLESGQMTLQ